MGPNDSETQEPQQPGMLDGIIGKVTGMFKKPDGGMNWGSIIGMVAGGALAMFAAPMIGAEGIMAMLLPVAGAAAGAFAGKMIGDHQGASGQDTQQPSAPAMRQTTAGGQLDYAPPQHLPVPPRAGMGR